MPRSRRSPEQTSPLFGSSPKTDRRVILTTEAMTRMEQANKTRPRQSDEIDERRQEILENTSGFTPRRAELEVGPPIEKRDPSDPNNRRPTRMEVKPNPYPSHKEQRIADGPPPHEVPATFEAEWPESTIPEGVKHQLEAMHERAEAKRAAEARRDELVDWRRDSID